MVIDNRCFGCMHFALSITYRRKAIVYGRWLRRRSWSSWTSGQAFPHIAPTPLAGRNILPISHARIPPYPFTFYSIVREQEFEPPFSVITRLLPCSTPFAISDSKRRDVTALPGIGAISVLIQARRIGFIFLLDLPLSGKVRSIGALKRRFGWVSESRR
jgi:hypothetical protein